MKRSEMVSHIHEELKDLINSYESASSKRVPHLIKHRAEELLDVLEGFGMLPPERYRDHNWNELDISYSEWLQLPGKVNEWEPEK